MSALLVFKNTLQDIPLLTYDENIQNYQQTPCLYKSNIGYMNRMNELVITQSIQDIKYVRDIAISLESGNPSQYQCDLQGIPEKYIILENIKDSDGDDYLICGYPDPKKMRHYLKVYENDYPGITEIHNIHKQQLAQHYAKLHNQVNRHNLDNIISIETGPTPDNFIPELYKFYWENVNLKYIKK